MNYFSKRPNGTSESIKEQLIETTKDQIRSLFSENSLTDKIVLPIEQYESGEAFSGRAVEAIKSELESIYNMYNNDLRFIKMEVLQQYEQLLMTGKNK